LLRTLWSYLDRDTGRIPVIEIGDSGWNTRGIS
jgi:hypothetical protein